MNNNYEYLIYLNNVRENWIVDRTRKEWHQNQSKVSTRFVSRADIIWLIASWNWLNVKEKHLDKKKVLCSIYHIDEEKFDEKEERNFIQRDEFVDEYHVISKKTKSQVEKLTRKKITSIPFWVNTDIWFEIKDKELLRKKYNFNKDKFYIGSFQRDSEGSDTSKPKLSKGPDRFIKIVDSLRDRHKDIHIILTGKRRDYLINELSKLEIEFSYFEMADFKTINELYNCLDLYIVASRFEGGPQSILECGVTNTPIISTDVGVASEILSPESIFDMSNYMSAEPNLEIAFKNSQKYEMEKSFSLFHEMLKGLHES